MSPRKAALNRVELSGRLLELGALRYTPAGIAAVEFKLRHESTLAELEHSFKFSDAVLRHLIVKMPKAHTTPSPMMREEKSKSLMERGGEIGAEPGRAERPAA